MTASIGQRVIDTFGPAMQGDYAEALRRIEALLHDTSDDGPAAGQLDWREQNALRMFNNYLICCLKERQYEKGAAFAERLQPAAAANPHIFHNAACLYCFVGELDKAMAQLHLAGEHGGAELIALLAGDEDLAPLAQHRDFQKLVGRLLDDEGDADRDEGGGEAGGDDGGDGAGAGTLGPIPY